MTALGTVIGRGTLAARPAAGIAGQLYFATDGSGTMYRDNGTTWDSVETSGGTSVTTKGDLQGFSTLAARIPIGADTQVLTADSTQALGLKWAAAAGGGVTHTYYGKNAIGASSEAMVNGQSYLKSITLAAAGTITSVGAYVKGTSTSAIQSMMAGVFSDVAGVASLVIAAVSGESNRLSPIQSGGTQTFRWLHLPIGLYVAAGTYWIAVLGQNNGSSLTIAYDTSGSDRTYSGMNAGFSDVASPTNSTKDYSIRADVLS